MSWQDVDVLMSAAHLGDIAGPSVRAGKWAWIYGYIGGPGSVKALPYQGVISVGTIPEDAEKRVLFDSAWSKSVPEMTLIDNHYLSV